MKLGKGDKGAKGLDTMFKDKQNPVAIVAVIVIILVAGFFVARNFMGGDEYGGAGDASMESELPGGMPPGPPGMGGPPPGPGATAPPPSAPPVSPPSASAAAPPKPAGRSGEGARARTAESAGGMNQLTVFGKVVVSYPKGWGIDPGSASSAAVFTNNKAVFEVRPPDPKAPSAKAIAKAAVKTMAKGASVVAEGKDKVSGYDAHWFAVKLGGQTYRIVGIDGPTRIAIRAYVKSGGFDAYRATFDKMQSEIKFR